MVPGIMVEFMSQYSPFFAFATDLFAIALKIIDSKGRWAED
jgi:hypothetical protein